MADPKQTPSWQGRPVLDQSHGADLDSAAAVHEFQGRMPRDQAEDRAHGDYRKQHHRSAAAFHLQGMRASQATGEHESAKKHGVLYALHLKELGLDPYGEPPEEIRRHAESPEREKLYRFKAHRGDSFLLGKDNDTEKSEIYLDRLPLRKSAREALDEFWELHRLAKNWDRLMALKARILGQK